MKLTLSERLIISNQFRILSLLDKQNSGEYERKAFIIERGYRADYDDDVIWYIDKNELDESVSTFVHEVLKMHGDLQVGFDKAESKHGIRADDLVFIGFSSNESISALAYTRFVLSDKLAYIKLIRNEDLDSHVPVMDRYKKMLIEWKKSADRYDLTIEDIQRILNA